MAKAEIAPIRSPFDAHQTGREVVTRNRQASSIQRVRDTTPVSFEAYLMCVAERAQKADQATTATQTTPRTRLRLDDVVILQGARFIRD